MTRKLFALGCFAFFIFTLSSCNKEDEPQNDWHSNGKASFKINGEVLNTEVRAVIRDGKYSIWMEYYREKFGELWPMETLGIRYLVNKEDSIQRIFSGGKFGTDTVFGSFDTRSDIHIGGDSYAVIEQDSINNWVRIDKQQNNFKEMWGSFRMHLYKASDRTDLYADTILITDGKFHFSL